MRGRLDLREIELADLADGLEDRAELLLDPAQLVGGKLEAREARDMDDVFSPDRHF